MGNTSSTKTPFSIREGVDNEIEVFYDENGKKIKCIESYTGTTTYYEGPDINPYRKNGLPTVVKSDGSAKWYDKNGELHRANGPANIYGCKKKLEMIFSHEKNMTETISHFYEWWEHGRKKSFPC